MATPTLRAIRGAYPGIFIGGLCRSGIDELLAGSGFIDELHVARASGVMGIKRAAAKIGPRQYDTTLLLTNSFSTAMTVRVAGIPRRIGYDRDARGLLLTDRIEAPKRPDGAWAAISAVDYYWNIASRFLIPDAPTGARGFMELGVSPAQAAAGDAILAAASIQPSDKVALLNPGGNDPAKRWPPDRFAAIADLLAARGWKILVNGSPAEAELLAALAGACRAATPVLLPGLGITLGSLKRVIQRANLMLTNDTGPRHMAAALGVPLVTLFGPTDRRWAIIPTRPGAPEIPVLADPTLPDHLFANDHAERCAMTKIEVDRVWDAVIRLI